MEVAPGANVIGVSSRLRHALYLVAEKLLTFVVVPQLRARLLGALGAEVGSNVRIYEVRLFNLEGGFSNLRLADDVHVGNGVLLDLSAPLIIERGAVVSPRCNLLTHVDVGEHHHSPMVEHFPTTELPIVIGASCYLGVGVTVLPGVELAELTAVGAHSMVRSSTTGNELVAGTPAVHIRPLSANSAELRP